MKKNVTGIGGLFFRCKNRTALSKWYQEHFGINTTENRIWKQEKGPAVFSPFPKDTDYFGKSDQQFMVNLRVNDLETLLAELERDGITIDSKRQDDAIGKFAWVYDPEGNKIELWQPNPETDWENLK